MDVFVTGATGFVGSAIVQELIGAGHKVLGLARSDKSAAALAAAGAKVQRGSLEDLDSLKNGAAGADGVIHTAFIHDFSNYGPACQMDKRAIEALGVALTGTRRPLIVTSGTALLTPGRVATEEDVRDAHANPFPRVSEETAMALAERGVNASVVRLPPSVHGDGDHGFVSRLIAIAREKGVSAYIGDGANRWPAVHRLDAAHLYRLVLENSDTGARYHAIGDEGVAFRDIAGVIGRKLNLPVAGKSGEDASSHFGWIAPFAAIDCPASAVQTQKQLGWRPTQPGLIADLENGRYFKN